MFYWVFKLVAEDYTLKSGGNSPEVCCATSNIQPGENNKGPTKKEKYNQ